MSEINKLKEQLEEKDAKIAELQSSIKTLEGEKAELVKAGEGLDELQKKLESREGELKIAAAVVEHYGDDLDSAMDRVAFNRKGEIIGYAPEKTEQKSESEQESDGGETSEKAEPESKAPEGEKQESSPPQSSNDSNVLQQLYQKHTQPANDQSKTDPDKMSDEDILAAYEQQLKDELSV